MFEHVLVPLDGSPFSATALEQALAICSVGNRELVCCHAVDTRGALASTGDLVAGYDPTSLIDALQSQGKAILADAAARADQAKVRARTELIFDSPVSATTHAAQTCGADLIVMGTQGRTGLAHALLGSTTEGILRTCTVPVMTVRIAPRRVGYPFARALVAVDDSDPSDATVAVALALAEHDRTRLIFCNAVAVADLLGKASTYGYDARPMLDELNAAARALLSGPTMAAQRRDVEAGSIVVDGEAGAEILKAAATMDADVIIIGSRGRRGLHRLFVGSVAEHVVRESVVPVLVVRTAEPSFHRQYGRGGREELPRATLSSAGV